MAATTSNAVFLAAVGALALGCTASEPEPFSPLGDLGKADATAPLYCGAITEVGIETDIFAWVALVNQTRTPEEAVIRDQAAALAVARYLGEEDTGYVDWWTGDQEDEYFACVWGEYDEEPFIHGVTKVKFWKNRALDDEWVPQGQAPCDEALLHGFTVDSSSWQVGADDIEGFWESDGLNLSIAIDALARLEDQLGCDDSATEAFVLDQLTCSEVQPDNPGSSVCYGESAAGYYFLTRDMLTSVNVVFNRWD